MEPLLVLYYILISQSVEVGSELGCPGLFSDVPQPFVRWGGPWCECLGAAVCTQSPAPEVI